MSKSGANAKRAETARKTQMLKVQISIPSGDTCKTDFALCLAKMAVHGAFQYDGKVTPFHHAIVCARSSNLAGSRNLLAATALKDGADYLLFLDSDMSFPPDTLGRLLAAAEFGGADVIGCSAPTRSQWAVMRDSAYEIRPSDGARRSFSAMRTEGVHEVSYVGTGIMLIRTAVFRRIPKPWFLFDYRHADVDPDANAQWFEGEDHYFCRKAREAGYRIHVDFDLSRQIGHVGTFRYTADEAADVASVRTMTPEQMRAKGNDRVRLAGTCGTTMKEDNTR